MAIRSTEREHSGIPICIKVTIAGFETTNQTILLRVEDSFNLFYLTFAVQNSMSSEI